MVTRQVRALSFGLYAPHATGEVLLVVMSWSSCRYSSYAGYRPAILRRMCERLNQPTPLKFGGWTARGRANQLILQGIDAVLLSLGWPISAKIEHVPACGWCLVAVLHPEARDSHAM